ncbi:MAG: SMP-30/gluconolactonase/LRE family protein [Rhodospirillales bacterium]|nr:SMP-30/gluconolactonase/LRE family protein [Rhodospirillales bacterium]MDH3913729.1 SMP-30/gluconolactonase/LRE family protein [Rhodospirillales bacterium]MDH3917750.1 SMP-30/gluconolactonase/LRE family protein [Rhodospirillales bacterium]MDH3965669.1 SMP-30/gluconolactonase/LRE family protein [Rhodospirillales bacterium]
MSLKTGLRAEVAWDAKAMLGESPLWDERAQCLYWVDIEGATLYRQEPGQEDETTALPLETPVGSIAPREGGGLVAASYEGFALLDPTDGRLDTLVDPESHLPDNRFNDGKCDPAGRFVAGSRHYLEVEPTGAVHVLEADGTTRRLFGDYAVCNGPAFSPDGRTLYFSNSVERTVLAFDYDPAHGAVGRPRVFARFDADQGLPDGLTVDAEGFLWCAHWMGWRVTRLRPDGREDGVIELPVPHVTSCTFGGAALDVLYITTARMQLGPEDLARAPLAGALFKVAPGVTGLPAARFAG